MPVRLSYPSQFAELIGEPGPLELEGGTVGEVLGALEARRPELARLLWQAAEGPMTPGAAPALNPMIVLFVNGEDVRGRNGLLTPVREGDELVMVSAIEGG